VAKGASFAKLRLTTMRERFMKLIMTKLTMTEISCAALLLLFAVYTHAAIDPEKQNKAEYDAAIARADADYKVASEACNSQKGHDKEVCIQQAKANRDTAKADANAALKSKDAVADVRDDKLVAQYKVARKSARR
jgi:16S rRNA G527 N7-methylase RsmG